MRVRWTILAGGLLALAAAAPAGSQGGPPLPPPAPAPTTGQSPAPPVPSTEPALTPAEMREVLVIGRAIAKSTRETAEYSSVMPDILTQVLAKLDKLEDKLDKIEDVLRKQRR